MITVTGIQQEMAAIEKRRKRGREDREALTAAHAAAEAEAETGAPRKGSATPGR